MMHNRTIAALAITVALTIGVGLAVASFEPFVSLGTVIVTGVLGLVAIWWKDSLENLRAAVRPVSNGFAAGTTDRLDRVLEQLGRIHAVLDDQHNRITRLEQEADL